MDALVAMGAPWPGAIAVSGGGDSVALMHLLATWARRRKRPAPAIVTVDHGLRAGSASDARKVVRWAKSAGLKSHALRWEGPHPNSDIEAAARQARYRLMGEWARANDIDALYVAHTLDDQAETFLLRLIRGSGLDGLSAMRTVAPYPIPGFRELRLVRPLLSFERAHVRAHLKARKVQWIEDAMNDDERFARVRLRKAWPALEGAGLSRFRVAAAAAHLARARDALEMVTDAVFRRAVRPSQGGVHVDGAALVSAPREIGLRALAQLLQLVSQKPYRPRFERLERLYDGIAEGTIGGGCTLHGCRIAFVPKRDGAFGEGTLAIVPENVPQRAKGGKKRASAQKSTE
ncbi:MAG TPA: tRNA lysidine(34) synthetase TilS [Rhizomicrobium sp.]|jgi:tRNA(Ile)-lysidine synthase